MDRRSFFKAAGAAVAAGSAACPAAARGNKELPPDAVGLLFDSTLCVGCKACVAACKEANGMPPEFSTQEQYWDTPLDISGKTLNVIKAYRHGSLATRFLETELIKELYFLADEQRAGRARAPVVGEGSALVERARAAIEASLFAPFAMAALARACHASESTLTRAFKQALGITPGAYVRERRLDEAMPLLESGRYSVGEVASRVGYARQAAFAAAFQRKFHVAPSRVRPRSGAPPLAPHGRPPVRAPRAGR